MDADGSNPIRFTHSPGDDWYPSWSPDSKYIIFSSWREGGEIYRIDVDGSNLINITNNSFQDWASVYSVDGEKIYFTSYRNGSEEVCVMDADGSNQTCLTSNPAKDRYPDQTLRDYYYNYTPLILRGG